MLADAVTRYRYRREAMSSAFRTLSECQLSLTRFLLATDDDLHARDKRAYPPELSCDDATADLVTRRWNEYFPARNVAMGDSARGHLD